MLRLLGGFALVVIAGVGIGFTLFAVTSFHPNIGYLGPGGVVDDVKEGFDLWTGLPHGRSYRYDPESIAHGASELIQSAPPPADMQGRRAIPLPVGFAIGSGAAAGTLLLISRRRAATSLRGSRARPAHPTP